MLPQTVVLATEMIVVLATEMMTSHQDPSLEERATPTGLKVGEAKLHLQGPT